MHGISLTKGEVLGLVDLGVAIKRPSRGGDGVEVKNEDGTVGDADERDDYTLLTAVVEEAEGRFSDEQLTDILTILKVEMPLRAQGVETLVGVKLSGENRGVSVPAASPSSEAEGEGSGAVDGAGEDEDEVEDETLSHEANFGRKENDGDIDGED